MLPRGFWQCCEMSDSGNPHVNSDTHDEFDRLERLLYRPVSTRPDWLKAWRNEAQYLLYLARRAVDADDEELVEELEEQARDMADVVEARLRNDSLL